MVHARRTTSDANCPGPVGLYWPDYLHGRVVNENGTPGGRAPTRTLECHRGAIAAWVGTAREDTVLRVHSNAMTAANRPRPVIQHTHIMSA